MKRPRTTHGFAIPLQPDTQLGLAMLIAEDEEGHYQPVAVASTIDEAKELATSDLRGRMRDFGSRRRADVPLRVQGLGTGRRWRLPRGRHLLGDQPVARHRVAAPSTMLGVFRFRSIRESLVLQRFFQRQAVNSAPGDAAEKNDSDDFGRLGHCRCI